VNRLVARFADGHLVKGMTVDFSADKDTFHMVEPPPNPGWDRTVIPLDDLKAVFFVKDFDGDPQHVEARNWNVQPEPGERRVEVIFNDGETLVGTTPTYRADPRGFFVIPVDSESNNRHAFVLESATREVRFF